LVIGNGLRNIISFPAEILRPPGKIKILIKHIIVIIEIFARTDRHFFQHCPAIKCRRTADPENKSFRIKLAAVFPVIPTFYRSSYPGREIVR